MNIANLSKQERSEYMRMQMAPRHTRYGGYLPDDCSECGYCGEAMLGSGWCVRCLNRFNQLISKATR